MRLFANRICSKLTTSRPPAPIDKKYSSHRKKLGGTEKNWARFWVRLGGALRSLADVMQETRKARSFSEADTLAEPLGQLGRVDQVLSQ